MKKDFREFFYLKYHSRNAATAIQSGADASESTGFNSPHISIAYSKRNENELTGQQELMSAKERSFFGKHFNMESAQSVILRASDSLAIESLNTEVNAILNLKELNDLKSVNTFLKEVNNKLPVYGLFGCCVSPRCIEKKRMFKKLPPLVSHAFYFFYFIFNRLFPKLPVTSKLYFWLTGGRTRVMSKTEAMGRLYAHGFKITDEKIIGDKIYFVFHKIKKPIINHVPTYGIIFKMLRKGKNGKLIYVYKMRTMDAYSEYLQQYIYEQNNLDKGGKFKDDFRVTTFGRFLRKYWIDELPMIINLIRGDLKLVGVRPLSQHYLSFYSGNLREKRSRCKPGLLPPFYADMPDRIEDIMASEMRYLSEYERNPLFTDIKYFFKILYTILIKRARSK